MSETKKDRDTETEMTSLAYRVVVAYHFKSHVDVDCDEFEDCRQGFCGEWHSLQEEVRRQWERDRGEK